MKLLTLATLAPFVARASADAIHIVNANLWFSQFLVSAHHLCFRLGLFSQISQYYTDDSQSNNGQKPSAENVCTFPGNEDFTGKYQTCAFSTGVSVTSYINDGAEYAKTGDYVGYENSHT